MESNLRRARLEYRITNFAVPQEGTFVTHTKIFEGSNETILCYPSQAILVLTHI